MASERSVLTLPLRIGKADAAVFDARLRTAQRLYNSILTRWLDRADAMRESETYRQLVGERRTAIAEGRLEGAKPKGFRPTPNPCAYEFADSAERGFAWRVLRERFGLYGSAKISSYSAAGKAAYESDKAWMIALVAAQGASNPSASLGSALIRHSLERRARERIDGWIFGRTGRPRRRSRRDPLTTVESSSATSVQSPAAGKATRDTLRFDPRTLELVWVGAGGAHPARARAIVDPSDVIARKGLQLRLVQVRVVRKTIRRRPAWFVQLVLEGVLERKRIGARAGIVGVDLGTQHVAAVAADAGSADATDAALITKLVLDHLREKERKRRKVQRRMTAALVATNAEAITRNKNGAPAGFRRGVRLMKSAGYRRLEVEIRDIARAERHARAIAHGTVANGILRLGTSVRLERLSYVAWQRAHGRSTGRTAPGAFVTHLSRRAALYGGGVVELPVTLKLSQLCFCGAFTIAAGELSKPIARRASSCAHCDREVAQRDLFSSFLAAHVDARETAVMLTNASTAWSAGADQALRRVWQQYQAADVGHVRGLHGRRSRRSARKCASAREHHDAHRTAVAATVCESGGGIGMRDSFERPGDVKVTQDRSKPVTSRSARRRVRKMRSTMLRAGPSLDSSR